MFEVVSTTTKMMHALCIIKHSGASLLIGVPSATQPQKSCMTVAMNLLNRACT
jgi:hypothetical protein